ncbi:TonB-dependent receptor [bacterium SCSIO 12696]|nr:TonB-dependent receptor [bacterium SCSIO 12696]
MSSTVFSISTVVLRSLFGPANAHVALLVRNSVRNWPVGNVLLLSLVLAFAPDLEAAEDKYHFNIAAADAAQGLRQLAQQSNTPLLFSHSEIRDIKSNAVRGRYTVREALAILLKGSRYTGQFNQNGVLTISKVEPEKKEGRDMPFKKNGLTALIAAVAGASASLGAVAQDNSKDIQEEIVVKGIKGSLQRALNIKENSTGFVDAISAEDVGKLPDQNVAEALQRVTGVAIQRSRGEGDFVSIRGLGPDFVRGSVNGRSFLSATEAVDPIFNGNELTTTGRAANFDILPSEIIRTLEVAKSTSASHVEGGIGGSVDLKTARPLELGHKKAGTLTGTYRQFNSETDPSISGLYSWVNDDNSFGALGSIAYSERSIREDFSRTFGWFPSFGIGSQLDTDNDGIGDASPNDVPFSLSNNAEAYEESRDRVTAMGTLQWDWGESGLVVDLLYSKREIDESHQNFIFLPIIFDDDLAGNTVNPDGSVQVGDLVNDGTFFRHITTLRPELTTDLQDIEEDLISFGLNYEKQSGAWTTTTDISYSKAEGSNVFDRVRIDGDRGTFAFDSTIDNDGFDITQTNLGDGAAADLGNPANFVVSVFDDRFARNEDEEFAIQFDAIRDIDHDVVSSIEMGVRYRSREKAIERASNGNGIPVVGAGIGVDTVSAFNRGASDFLDGSYRTNFGFDSLIFPDNDAARAAVASRIAELAAMEGSLSDDDAGLLATLRSSLAPISPDPFGSFAIEEDTFAGYFQVNFEGDLAGVGYVGDIGFRLVHTDLTVNGFDAEFVVTDNGGMDTTIFDTLTTGAATPVSFESSYTNVLPSLNFRFELAENLYLRVASNDTITRPTFNSLAPAFDINANASTNGGDNFAVSLNAGNPALEPAEAENYDLGVEWYFGEGSAVYAGLFHKEIEGFTANVVNTGSFTSLAGTPIRATGVEMDGTSRPIPVDIISQPANQGLAQVSGAELGVQQAFESGFGYIANVTLNDTSAELESTGESIDFPGVSDTSFNLTFYYEKGPIQARAAYTSRSEFLRVANAIGSGGQIFNDDFSQLDASFSYDISPNLTIFLNGVNLTDEEQDVFQILPAGQQRWVSTSFTGRRVALGIRGTF